MGRPFLFGWIHSGFHFWPVCWDTSWLLAHMVLEVANQKPGGSRICFPTHLHRMSLGSHFELMLMVEVGAAPRHPACREEEEASARSWGCPLHSWMAAEGWQAGPGVHFHFCLSEVVEGGGLICLAGPSLEEGASRWVGEGEARSVQVKAKEVPRR